MKKYIVKFERTMIAEVEVSGEDEDDVRKRFDKGEWDDHYDTVQILEQGVCSVKEKQ